MPTIVFFLAKMGLVTARQMMHYFKYAILGIFIVAAAVAPSPDMGSQFIVAIPMIGLYFVSVLIAWLFGKKREAEG
jgi:sec-independent protein translocase protein TatC